MIKNNDLTISQLLHYLLPLGTRGTPGDFSNVLLWPLDLFGVSAYLVQQSDCHTRLLEHSSKGIGTHFSKIRKGLVDAGLAWRFESNIDSASTRKTYKMLDDIHHYWSILIKHQNCLVRESSENNELVLALLALIAIADEACASVGFFYGQEKGISSKSVAPWVPAVFDYVNNSVDRNKFKPYRGDWYLKLKPVLSVAIKNAKTLPSGCLLIPSDRLCVLPKSHTPSLGCTLRSLTHNLALHPSATQVSSRWFNYQRYEPYEIDSTLNILIVPLPYSISPSDFEGHHLHDSTYCGFTIKQSWLPKHKITIAKTIIDLVDRCAQENTLPNVIVFPEAALDPETHHQILNHLAKDARLSQLIVISGISGTTDHHHVNYSSTAYISNKKIQLTTGQKKHHRWKLDSSQIKSYGLETSLSPDQTWWELAEVDERTINYHVFNNGACISTLICEDLARTDPCKPSINASAPNLVFALLMDGPQVASRWPGRYALGLADDPGSAVLTVSSLGLIERSNWRYNNVRQTIALWGGADGVKELDLPQGKQALVLTIEKQEKKPVSLDGRRSVSAAVQWSYKGHKAV